MQDIASYALEEYTNNAAELSITLVEQLTRELLLYVKTQLESIVKPDSNTGISSTTLVVEHAINNYRIAKIGVVDQPRIYREMLSRAQSKNRPVEAIQDKINQLNQPAELIKLAEAAKNLELMDLVDFQRMIPNVLGSYNLSDKDSANILLERVKFLLESV